MAHQLEQLLHERIAILDGAMGTMIQAYELDEAAFRGDQFREHEMIGVTEGGYEVAPWLALWPGLCLTVVVYVLNMFGDAMRDLLDPRLRDGEGRLDADAARPA